MNREIKFRAWDKELEILHPVQDLQFGNNGKTHVFLALGEDICSDGFAPEKFDLMQYTGLKDKDGEEIYEGDIIKTEHSEKLAVVIFKTEGYLAGAFCLKQTDGKIRQFSPDNIWMTSDEPRNWDDVIGNIYENSELLEAVKDGE